MSDSDTARFDMTRNEARVVIAALSDEEMTASGDRGMRLQNVQDHLAAEFDFDEHRGVEKGEMAAEDDTGWLDNDAIFGGNDPDDTEEIELSRAEADVVTDALTDFELDETHENAGTAENVRQRIADSFDDR
ncbi:hypothetical protein M0R88_16695 [Halorussus gelatinilyticus]|uniref:Uncharacterized protein n=1 Tax=Halorussus gelatinilyticus TaxID=2937524 RepID=A0A8U0IJ89_9EURY|nr:hypothetical protein [Halorussus gelatinilyticus]UPW00139.1 hypothetical protein M0R88_16695 [Halorussus gelatinilyticus]